MQDLHIEVRVQDIVLKGGVSKATPWFAARGEA
jgi:hypothetical protein